MRKNINKVGLYRVNWKCKIEFENEITDKGTLVERARAICRGRHKLKCCGGLDSMIARIIVCRRFIFV